MCCFLLTFLFGIFLVLVGILMYFNPTVVRNLIRKAGSSYGTNFLELGPRLLIGLAIIKVDTDFEVLYNSWDLLPCCFSLCNRSITFKIT